MLKFKYLLFLFILFFFVGCIPTKDLIYLQSSDKGEKEFSIEQVVLKPYRIQSHDILQITIKAIDQKLVEMFNPRVTTSGTQNQTEQGTYFDGFSVDDHGNIRVPILGELFVLGMTLDEVRVTVENKLLSEYFNSQANIFVNVKLSGFRYTINGEVLSPGTKLLYRDKVNIMEAIANAGDITITGERKDVIIIRQQPQGLEIHTIDLTNKNVMKSPYYFLQPNDYIYIKPLKQKTWGTGTTGVQSFSTIISGLTLLVSTYLIFKNL